MDKLQEEHLLRIGLDYCKASGVKITGQGSRSITVKAENSDTLQELGEKMQEIGFFIRPFSMGQTLFTLSENPATADFSKPLPLSEIQKKRRSLFNLFVFVLAVIYLLFR